MAKYNWYKEGQALLEEIKNTNPAPGMVALWYIGQMGVIVKGAGLTVCLDPMLSDLCEGGVSLRNYSWPFEPGELTGIDYVICSHDHADHINMETLLPLYQANPEAKFIVPAPTASVLTQGGIAPEAVVGAKEKQTVTLVEGAAVTPVAAAHEQYLTDENGDQCCLSYVLDLGGIRLFHGGDTVVTEQLISDVQEIGAIQVACLPVNGVDTERHRRDIIGNMDCRDAAFFAQQIGADMVIPMHYDMVLGNEENPLIFGHYMQSLYSGRKFHIMQLGERLIYMK